MSERRVGMSRLHVFLAGLIGAVLACLAMSPSAMATGVVDPIKQFGFSSFETGRIGTADAGGHPSVYTEFQFKSRFLDPTEETRAPFGTPRKLWVSAPKGLVGNPQASPQCERADYLLGQCPPQTMVGVAEPRVSMLLGGPNRPVYNLVPDGTSPALFVIDFIPFLRNFSYLRGEVHPRTGQVTIAPDDLPTATPLLGNRIDLWGIPYDENVCNPNHPDYDPFASSPYDVFGLPCPATDPEDWERKPFISSPTDCSVFPHTTIRAVAYEEHAPVPEASFTQDHKPENCDTLPFDPQTSAATTTSEAGSPTGLEVSITMPQSDDPGGRASAHIRNVEMTLPEGMTVNPSIADGLGSCTDAQFAQDDPAPSGCPEAAKIGTVEIDTPLLPSLIDGDIYVAEQTPEHLMRLFFEVAGHGARVKIAGVVERDPETGRVTSRFTDNAQQPFRKLTVRIKNGPRSPLTTPRECGTHTVQTRLTGWSGQVVQRQAAIGIDRNCGARGFAPGFAAGAADTSAGVETSFGLSVSRGDKDNELKTMREIKLPRGLVGAVGSVPLCDASAADAGACSEESRIGRVEVAAGAGPNPLWVPQAGKAPTGVYLTGPYDGAPFGLSIKVPAQAGPFNLGTVVVRSALHVDERTAQITTGVEETRLFDRDGRLTKVLPGALPRIIDGVVLDQREIRVLVDRSGLMRNPTNCSEQQTTAELVSYRDETPSVASRFEVGDCARLGFAPRLRARILDRGRKSTLRSWHPRTRFTVVPRKGDANIAGARVALPSSTILDQANIGTTCTRQQMAERNCPRASIVGHAKAWSPLLGRPIQGPVYLAANGGVRPLPDLAAVMDGEIRVMLLGEISTLRNRGKARLQNTFRVVPDAPVSRFILTMRGGKKRGLLVNSTDLCRTNERGLAVFRGQNGRSHRLRLRVETAYRGCAKVRRQLRR